MHDAHARVGALPHCPFLALPSSQASLCYLSPKELQCLLGYIITRHGAALGPRSGHAAGELLSSSAAAAAAADYSSGSEGGGSSDTEDFGGSTPDLGSPTTGILVPGGAAAARAVRRHRSVQQPSYDPGCASVFGFGLEAEAGGALPLLLEGGDAAGSASAGSDDDDIATAEPPGAALLRQQLAALGGQRGAAATELVAGGQLSGDECLEPHPWWIEHLSHKARLLTCLACFLLVPAYGIVHMPGASLQSLQPRQCLMQSLQLQRGAVLPPRAVAGTCGTPHTPC